jgi:predicted acetyltransferase
MKDLGEFRDSIVRTNGRYRDDRLRTYLAYEEHWPILIRSDGEVAGFALIRKSKPDTHLMGEFFIKSEFRRSGVGGAAVAEVLEKFKGNWEIPFQIENTRAAAFWRNVISQLGIRALEINLPVIDNPELPHDVWLNFTNSDI